MTRSSYLKDLYIHVEVLQNGVPMTTTCIPAWRRKKLILTNNDSQPFSLPLYGFPRNKLDILKTNGKECRLLLGKAWYGFATQNGEPTVVNRHNSLLQNIALQRGDYASLAYGDLRVLIKVKAKPQSKPRKSRASVVPGNYRRSIWGSFFSGTYEQKSLLAGTAAAAFLIGCLAYGLASRPVARPAHLGALKDIYVLPFIQADHIQASPELLQDNLNRSQWLVSILDYFKAFVGVQTDKSYPNEEKYISPTTRQRYAASYKEVHRQLDAQHQKQAKADRQTLTQDFSALVVIPSVVGETAAGSMLRVVDKATIVNQMAETNLNLRRSFTSEFPKDPPYNYEDYKNPQRSTSPDTQEYLSKINPWGDISPDTLMYQQAEALAAKARAFQDPKRASLPESELLRPTDHLPVSLIAGSPFVSYLPVETSLVEQKRFAAIQAASYLPVAKRPKIKEPLVGKINPSLIETYIEKHRFQLQLCYEVALRRNNNTRGLMEWRWRIDTRGFVTDLALINSSLQDLGMTECVRQKIAGWRFPKPKHGSVEILYPFEFYPRRG